jgi:hypothetical protein
MVSWPGRATWWIAPPTPQSFYFAVLLPKFQMLSPSLALGVGIMTDQKLMGH